MIVSIREFITDKYPQVRIISAEEVKPKIESTEEVPALKFYDVTFEYNGKKFTKLFHDRLKETVEKQFEEALKRADILILNKD